MLLPGLVQFRLCKLDDKELMEKLAKWLTDIYENKRIPSRQIPARPDDDFDLLLAELIVRFAEAKNIDI
jgi:hypothetical protein